MSVASRIHVMSSKSSEYVPLSLTLEQMAHRVVHGLVPTDVTSVHVTLAGGRGLAEQLAAADILADVLGLCVDGVHIESLVDARPSAVASTLRRGKRLRLHNVAVCSTATPETVSYVLGDRTADRLPLTCDLLLIPFAPSDSQLSQIILNLRQHPAQILYEYPIAWPDETPNVRYAGVLRPFLLSAAAMAICDVPEDIAVGSVVPVDPSLFVIRQIHCTPPEVQLFECSNLVGERSMVACAPTGLCVVPAYTSYLPRSCTRTATRDWFCFSQPLCAITNVALPKLLEEHKLVLSILMLALQVFSAQHEMDARDVVCCVRMCQCFLVTSGDGFGVDVAFVPAVEITDSDPAACACVVSFVRDLVQHITHNLSDSMHTRAAIAAALAAIEAAWRPGAPGWARRAACATRDILAQMRADTSARLWLDMYRTVPHADVNALVM